MSFVAAAIQMCSGKSTGANLEKVSELVHEAAAAGAHYVQTPEMTTLLTKKRSDLWAEMDAATIDSAHAHLAELARSLGIILHIGSMAVPLDDDAQGRVANRAHLFGDDGKLLCTYDKIHMFDVDLDHGESWRESAVYRPGEDAVLAEIAPNGDAINIGLSICYDLRFPELFRTLAKSGAHVLGTPAAFTRQTGQAHWRVLQRARAIETGCYMVSAAQCGLHEDGRETFGHAMIVDPWGRVLAETEGDSEGFAIAEIDPKNVDEARGKIPALKHDRPIKIRHATSATHSEAVA